MARRVSDDVFQTFLDCDVHAATRTLTLFGEVDRDMCERFIKNLHVLEAASTAPITILLNSDGGDDIQGQAIYEAIQGAASHCTVVGVGEVASIAAAIIQAADVRILRPRAEFMIHYGRRELAANTVDFRNTAKVQDANDRWYEKVLLERIRERHPTFKAAQLRRWLREDTYFSATAAQHWGLADEV